MRGTRWWQRWGCVVLLGIVVWGKTGCVAELSSQGQQVEEKVDFALLYATPEAYRGRTVVVGGEMVRLWSVPPGVTWFEVLHRPLGASNWPVLTAPSEGHFVVRCDQNFDPLLYQAGRPVTVVGRVLGTHTDSSGERREGYPLLACVDVLLQPQVSSIEPPPSVWLWWEWDPWYGGTWLLPPHHHDWWHRRYRPRSPQPLPPPLPQPLPQPPRPPREPQPPRPPRYQPRPPREPQPPPSRPPRPPQPSRPPRQP